MEIHPIVESVWIKRVNGLTDKPMCANVAENFTTTVAQLYLETNLATVKARCKIPLLDGYSLVYS